MPVTAAGVDTWSICWYLREDSSAHRAIEALATQPGERSRLLPEAVAGHRVGWFPGARLVFAEGRPAGIEGLARTDDLPGVAKLLFDSLGDMGLRLPHWPSRPLAGPVPGGVMRPFLGESGFAGIRRLDSTVDLEFESPAEGLAALAGVAALPVPRMKTTVKREVGGRRVETVYLNGSAGRTVLGRWYDKGIESGSHRRGLRVRPEDQRRFAKDARMPLEAVADGSYVRGLFVRRFEPLWRASKGVKVGGVRDIAARAIELVETGDLSPGEAKAMLGRLVLDSAGGDALQTRRQQQRDRALARNHGLVLADGVDDEVEVDLGEIIEEALDSSAWGCQG